MDKQTLLSEIAKRIISCKKCQLHKTATNSVSGNGNSEAEIIFIGEAPGYWEDQKGIPFCGAAGKLLDELLISINLDRNKVFVANMLKHRPPDNRDPLPEEMESCKEYLDEQVAVINPKAIVTLGRFSMLKFLPLAKISRDHGIGKIVEFNGNKLIVVPMFHPAAALRGADIEKMLREDFKRIPQEIERLEKVLKGETNVLIEDSKKEKVENEQLSFV